MKEYVSKDILLNVIERNTLWNTNEAFEGLIKNIPTVIKADIRAEVIEEFLYHISKHSEYARPVGWSTKTEIIAMSIIRDLAEQLKEQGE